MMRSYDNISNYSQSRHWHGGGGWPPPPREDIRTASGTSSAALVGLGVPVAALLADPGADQILRAVQFLRPCVAGDEPLGLPHHVELAVGAHFADEPRLGDVVVRKHLGDAAGQIRRLGA